MHLLLSNDDGIQAPGLVCMAAALGNIADITVAAPNRNRSGSSNSLTLERPLRATEIQAGWHSIDGTPTDCVHLGLTGLLEREPDMVVSGINAGPNLGDDVIYSGTVAAAMEGRFLGFPAVAFSLNSFQPDHWQSAAQVAKKVVENILTYRMPEDAILNVNIPDLPLSEIQGFEITRLGNRHKAEPAMVARDPRGKPIYWVGAAGPEQDAGPGTDFYAINHAMVSISPIHVDLTRYSSIDSLNEWLVKTKISL